MAASKLTIDLTPENRETLEKIKSEQRIPYGSTINELIHTFGSIPDSIKKEMISFIQQKMQTLYKEMDTAGVLQLEELKQKSQSYADIAAFLNNGKKVTIDKATSLTQMPQKILCTPASSSAEIRLNTGFPISWYLRNASM